MNSDKLTVVMYHYVRDLQNSRYPQIKGLDVRLFKEQVKFLKKHYNFVTVEQVINAYWGGYKLPPHAVLLSFDDAYADHFEYVFPVLEHEHIQGAFYPPVKAITEHTVLDVNKIHFILASTPEEKFPALLNEIKQLIITNTDEFGLKMYDDYFKELAVTGRFDSAEIIFVKRLLQVALPEKLRNRMTDILFEKTVGLEESAFSRELYMTVDQIKCMIDCGMHIGSHGYDHYWLGSLPHEKQEFEIKKSIEFINEVGGDVNNWTICYPYGDRNKETVQLLKENGCKLGMTTDVALADPANDKDDSMFNLPRLDTNDLPKDANAPVNQWY